MTIASTGGTVTLGLYDTQSQLKEKASITYVDNKVDPLQAGHKGYATLAQAQAAQSGLAANTVVEVLSDITEANNGYYLWNGTTLTKTTFSPLVQANNYTDSKVATAKAEAIATAASDATTKSNSAVTTANTYTDSVFADVPTILEPYVTQAEAAATAANIAGKVYSTPSEGVDPVTGVADGAYFNVRSPLSEHYIDEYQNINGVAVATGKSYPTSDHFQNISEHTALPFVDSTSYKLNQRVVLANGDIVKSTIDGNTNDPNSNMTGWVKTNAASQIIDASGLSQQAWNNGIESIADLLAIPNPKDGSRVSVKSYHFGLGKGGGWFTYDETKASINNGVTIFNGWVRDAATNLSVYDAGVKNSADHNDYNDHDSLRKLASVITSDATTSYVIDFADSNIIVGKAVLDTNVPMQASEMPFLLDFRTISPTGIAPKSVKIKANGAKIKWRNGMKLGTFLRSTGERYDPVMPFYPNTTSWNAQKDNVYVYPASFMIRVINVDSFEAEGDMYMDGNASSFIKGGGYGDRDWQLGGYGLQVYLVNHYHVSDWTSNDQPSDGFYLACTATPTSSGVAERLEALRNGRQACSMTGGHNLSYYDCNFRDSGIPSLPFPSAPKSNIDLEGEVAPMRNVNFYNCSMIGAGNESVISDTQDTADVTFHDCKIEGELSVWVNKPSFKFIGGHIKGAIRRLYGANDDEKRTKFFDVDFSDETVSSVGSFFIQAANGNPLFERCNFKITKSAWFWSSYTAITGTPFKLKGCTIDFAHQISATTGVFVFEDLTIIDNRDTPENAMGLNFSGCYYNSIKIISRTGVSGLIYSGGTSNAPVPNSNISKMFVGSPSIDYKVNYFEYVHRYGATGAPTVNSLLKNMYADNITNVATNTLLYNKGDTVNCTDPIARSGILKWVCTTAGYYNTAAWAASTAYAVNAYVNANGKVYKCTVAGISGATAPSHTSGTAADGAATWEYVGILAVFTAYGAKATGLSASSTAADIVAALKTAGLAS